MKKQEKIKKTPENSGKEEKPKTANLTKEQLQMKEEQKQQEIQQKILQQQEMLQNTGIFRLNLLNEITRQNDIFIELGQSLLVEIKGIKVALEKLEDTTEDKKE